MDRFSQACKDFGLTITLQKTNVLGQDLDTSPLITIDSYELDVFHLTLVLPSATTRATTCPSMPKSTSVPGRPQQCWAH